MLPHFKHNKASALKLGHNAGLDPSRRELTIIRQTYAELHTGARKTIAIDGRSYEVANNNGQPRVTRCMPASPLRRAWAALSDALTRRRAGISEPRARLFQHKLKQEQLYFSRKLADFEGGLQTLDAELTSLSLGCTALLQARLKQEQGDSNGKLADSDGALKKLNEDLTSLSLGGTNRIRIEVDKETIQYSFIMKLELIAEEVRQLFGSACTYASAKQWQTLNSLSQSAKQVIYAQSKTLTSLLNGWDNAPSIPCQSPQPQQESSEEIGGIRWKVTVLVEKFDETALMIKTRAETPHSDGAG